MARTRTHTPQFYSPLDKSKNQIRLLSFLSFTKIHLRLETYDLESCPPYEALSYTWGPESDITDGSITLNGSTIAVRHNLYQALESISTECSQRADSFERHWRTSRPKSPYLWIDALCIDQTDLLERNHQVGLMSAIFSSAATVRVWLRSDCALALALIALCTSRGQG